MNVKLTTMTALAFVLGTASAQMGKRWIDRYADSAYAMAKPAVGTVAPDLQLWDLDGRPRSLHLERGRITVLIAGSYT